MKLTTLLRGLAILNNSSLMLIFTANPEDNGIGSIPITKLGEIEGHPIYRIDSAYSSSNPMRVAEESWSQMDKTRRFE